MKNISAVRYVDAFYYTKDEEMLNTQAIPHVAVGELLQYPEHIIIIFSKFDDLPERGLVIPKSALILEENQKNEKVSEKAFHKKESVGLYWEDVVYFGNGKIPNTPTTMYTEGTIISETKEVVVIQHEDTIAIGDNGIKNHPKPSKPKPYIFVIPKKIITSVEIYED